MIRLKVYFLLMSSLCGGLSAFAAQGHKADKDPQAMAIAAKTFDAMGGSQALLAYQDSQADGTLTVYADKPPRGYPITIKSKTTQENRVEVQLAKGTNVRIANGGQAAIIRPDGTVRFLSFENTCAERVNHIPLLSLLADFQSDAVNVQYQGTADVNGQVADVIVLSFVPNDDPGKEKWYADVTAVSLFVDQATAMVDKVQYTNYEEQDPSVTAKVEVYYNKYQSADIMLVPFAQSTYVDGVLDTDIVLESIKFNVGLPDSDFTIPGGKK